MGRLRADLKHRSFACPGRGLHGRYVTMSRVPDRFDLWVRRARACPDPARQADYVLGALAALPYWHLLNAGSREQPQPAEGEVEGLRYLLVFSDSTRVEELLAAIESAPPPISMPTIKAFPWSLDRPGSAGLLVNPGEDAVLVPRDHVDYFYKEWRARQAGQPAGYWIPNMTGEEEDFWQEHGL